MSPTSAVAVEHRPLAEAFPLPLKLHEKFIELAVAIQERSLGELDAGTLGDLISMLSAATELASRLLDHIPKKPRLLKT